MNMSNGSLKAETIKILVCSGNLGNAQPDVDSIAAWIPQDGFCRHVLESKYSASSTGTNLGAADPAAPLPFENSLTTLLKEAKQTQQDIQNGKHEPSPRISMITRNSSSDHFSKVDDLIASCIIEQQEEEDSVQKEHQHDEDYDAFDSSRSLPLVNTEQFDIIVIGMQESTFDVIRQTSGSEDGESDRTSSTNLDAGSLPRSGSEDELSVTANTNSSRKPKSLHSLTVKAAKGSAKTVTKVAKGSATIVGKAAKGSAKKVTNAAKESAKTVSNLTATKDHTLSTSTNKGGNSDTHVLHDLLQEQLPSYSQAVSYQRGEMRLIVLYQQHSIDLDVLSVKAQNTGRAGLANKGGIVAELSVNQTTRLAFLTAHLEAHEGQSKYATRCSTIADIFKGTERSVSSSLRCDASISSHFMFVTGDLNFRTRLPDIEPGSSEHVEVTHQLAYANDYETLNQYDELALALKQKDALVGFQTPICNFPPTFKVLRQEGYKYKDNRSPSYTDRVLYLGADQLGEKIKVLGYEPIDNFSTSDHKPIRGAFEVELNQKLKWRPVLANRGFGGSTLSIQGNSRSMFAKKKAGKGRPSAAQTAREKLHLFVSNITCKLNPDTNKGEPSPFVRFVSTPSEACHMHLSRIEKLRKKLRLCNMNSKNDDHGWPQTRQLNSTYQPNWTQEEIHFVVRTHGDEGLPIDLTGAMLHIAVFDGKGKAEARLIGTFTLNLAHLINKSRERNRNKPQTAKSTRNLKGGQPRSFVNPFRNRGSERSIKAEDTEEPVAAPKGVLTQGPSNTLQFGKRASMFASRARKEAQAALNAEDGALSDMNIQALSLDEPLVKHGREVGRIQCTIDSWWMKEDQSNVKSRRF